MLFAWRVSVVPFILQMRGSLWGLYRVAHEHKLTLVRWLPSGAPSDSFVFVRKAETEQSLKDLFEIWKFDILIFKVEIQIKSYTK